MTARLTLALLGALPVLGCADMLGLGGLTFDQKASGGAATVAAGGSEASSGGAASGGTGGALLGSGGDPWVPASGGMGGQPQRPPSLTDDYPTTLSPGGVLVTTWQGFGSDGLQDSSTFWLYAPEAESLSTHRLDLLLADELGSSTVSSDWDLLYAPRFRDATWLFGYDEPTGLVDYGPPPTVGEAFEPATRAGSPGWTHIILAGDPLDPFLVAADSATGIVRIGPADPDVEDPLVTSIVWETAFTDLLPFQRNEVDGVLRLDSALGTADFIPIDDGMFGEPASLDLGLTPGWTLAASYSSLRGAALLLYRAGDGSVEVHRPALGSELFDHEDSLWQRGVSDIVTVHGDDAPWAVTYDSTTGVTDLRQLDPLDTVIVVK